MRVRCRETVQGDFRSGMEIGRDYLVLALEAHQGDFLLSPGLCVYVANDNWPSFAPMSFVELLDDNMPANWRVAKVGTRWLIGYPFMLDLEFHLALERADPSAHDSYRALVRALHYNP